MMLSTRVAARVATAGMLAAAAAVVALNMRTASESLERLVDPARVPHNDQAAMDLAQTSVPLR